MEELKKLKEYFEELIERTNKTRTEHNKSERSFYKQHDLGKRDDESRGEFRVRIEKLRRKILFLDEEAKRLQEEEQSVLRRIVDLEMFHPVKKEEKE